MKNKVPCIVLFCMSLTKIFFMAAIASMNIIDENLAAVVAVNCLSDVVCLYWIIDGLN